MPNLTNKTSVNKYWRLTNKKNDLIEVGRLHQTPIIGKSCIVGQHYTKNVIQIIEKRNNYVVFITEDNLDYFLSTK